MDDDQAVEVVREEHVAPEVTRNRKAAIWKWRKTVHAGLGLFGAYARIVVVPTGVRSECAIVP
jgi:hypothetical protein